MSQETGVQLPSTTPKKEKEMDVEAGDIKACCLCRKVPARRFKFHGETRELKHYRPGLPPETVKASWYFRDLCDEHAGKLLQHIISNIDVELSIKTIEKLAKLADKDNIPSSDHWRNSWPEMDDD